MNFEMKFTKKNNYKKINLDKNEENNLILSIDSNSLDVSKNTEIPGLSKYKGNNKTNSIKENRFKEISKNKKSTINSKTKKQSNLTFFDNIDNSNINNSSFIKDYDKEINSLFSMNFKKNKYMDSFFEENIKDNERLNITDLDPTIKDVLIAFVLSEEVYKLLLEEKSKRIFLFKFKD